MNKEYIIYGKSSCPFCVMATELLNSEGKEYDFVDLQDKVSILSEVKEYYKHSTVPIVIRGDLEDRWVFIGGYTELRSFIENR